jgi:Uma2 family endonuclease
MSAVLAAPPRTEAVDGPLYEVVYGERKEKSVGTRQNMIASRLDRMIGRFDPQEQLGFPVTENLFVLDAARDLERRPDLAFVSRQRWPGLPPDSNAWDVVPDWMVEIISPSNAADEVIDKVDEYFRAGTRLVWVIYPHAQRMYVYTSPTVVTVYEAADELTADPVLPTFRFTVNLLFDGIAVTVDRAS